MVELRVSYKIDPNWNHFKNTGSYRFGITHLINGPSENKVPHFAGYESNAEDSTQPRSVSHGTGLNASPMGFSDEVRKFRYQNLFHRELHRRAAARQKHDDKPADHACCAST